jgi:hypothetical protein
MSVSCQCLVLSGRGHCDEPITLPDEFRRVCLYVCMYVCMYVRMYVCMYVYVCV